MFRSAASRNRMGFGHPRTGLGEAFGQVVGDLGGGDAALELVGAIRTLMGWLLLCAGRGPVGSVSPVGGDGF
jgi:hypothetical protein